jgi:serine phosphatase RsbU (regulator of sigma subunit)
METFKTLEEKIDSALKGRSPALEFYRAVYAKIVHLSAQERKILIEKAEKLDDPSAFSRAALILLRGMSRVFDADFMNATGDLQLASDMFDTIDEFGGIMSANNLLSISYRSVGQLDKAQVHIQKALKAAEQVNRDSVFRYFKTVTFYQAGELNTISKNYEAAWAYYNKGMDFVGENPELEGRLLNGLGNMLMQTEEWEKALDYFERSLITARQAENPLLESKIYADIGNYYFKKRNFEPALENQERSLKIRIEKNFINPSITNYIHLAEIYVSKGHFTEAIRYGTMAVETAAKLNVLIKLYEAHEILSKAYEKAGDAAKAYEHFKLFHKFKEEVHNQEAIKKIEQLQTHHKVEIMQQEKEIFRLKNVELKSALDEITESVKYAKRIQNAILPSETLLNKTLPEHFILYKPKDIVAGDFYWMENSGDIIWLAACDCTGHGVPGAMVSVVCYNALNRSVREFKKRNAGEILDKTRELVIETFSSFDEGISPEEEQVKDGMDICLCGLKENKLFYSGANNPLWLLRKNEWIEIKATKQPVGVYVADEKYNSHSLELQKNDCVYLFTDGFADQFGGDKGKKLSYKKFREILSGIHHLPMHEQKQKLETVFAEWKGHLDQVDDVLVIGIRV